MSCCDFCQEMMGGVGSDCVSAVPVQKNGGTLYLYLTIAGLEERKNVGQPGTEMTFLNMHNIQRTEQNALRVSLFRPSAKNKVRVPRWGVGETASNLLEVKNYTCKTQDDRDDFFIAIKHLFILAWQKFFEVDSKIIPTTEIYQFHLFVTKRNRKGKLQVRFVILTTHKLYNVIAKSGNSRIEVQKCKWAFPLAQLENLTIYLNDAQAVTLKLSSPKKKAKLTDTTYLVDNSYERDALAVAIQRAYFRATKKYLHVTKVTL